MKNKIKLKEWNGGRRGKEKWKKKKSEEGRRVEERKEWKRKRSKAEIERGSKRFL